MRPWPRARVAAWHWRVDAAKNGAYHYALLDDHSRQLLHGRFSFRGNLPALELVFRRCLYLQRVDVDAKLFRYFRLRYRENYVRSI